MKTDRFISPIARAFWRRIEPYKNEFESELPEKLPVQFSSFMGTALSWLDDKILVWSDAPSEPNDNACCLVQMLDGRNSVGYYNDVQKAFALVDDDYVFLQGVKRWAEIESK